jgi:hypothetical protein
LSAEPGTRLDLGKPRALAELLDCTFDLQRRFFAVFFTVTALVEVPFVLLVAGVWEQEFRYGRHPHGGVAAGLAEVAIGSVVVPALVTALHVGIVQRLGQGQMPTVGRALQWVRPAVVPALIATSAYALGMAVGFALLVIPGLYLLVRWYFAPQVAIVEGERPGLQRSGQLVSGRWWTVAGRLLAMGILVGILTGLPTQVIGHAVHPAWVYVASQAVFGTIGASLSALFGTLLFFSLRVDAPVEPRRTRSETRPLP